MKRRKEKRKERERKKQSKTIRVKWNRQKYKDGNERKAILVLHTNSKERCERCQ